MGSNSLFSYSIFQYRAIVPNETITPDTTGNALDCLGIYSAGKLAARAESSSRNCGKPSPA
jgi:hypothetical protein